MSFAGMSLVEVAAAVATHLRTRGIEVVVVGGSAITSHVPEVYTSMDIDFAVTSGIDHRRIARALNKLGFHKRVAAFLHWSDSESLGVAERSAAAARDHLTWERIDAALRKLDTSLPERTQRITLARERLRRAIAGI